MLVIFGPAIKAKTTSLLGYTQTFIDSSALIFSKGQFDGQASFVSIIQPFFSDLDPVTAFLS